jgi:hypothetical protein
MKPMTGDDAAPLLDAETRASITPDQAKPTDDEQLWRGQVMADFRARLARSKAHQGDWRQEAAALYDLKAGRQWDPMDRKQLEDELRPVVTFNVAGKFLDAVEGLQINNRQEVRYYPRELGDAQANELLTGAVAWARDLCDLEDEESDAFGDAILTGMGWIECYLDKNNEPPGMPCGERRDPLEMYWDPGARKKNLSDGQYVIRIRYMTRDEYAAEFGEAMPLATFDAADIGNDEDPLQQLAERPEDYGTGSRSPGLTVRQGRTPVAHYEFWRLEKRMRVEIQGAPPEYQLPPMSELREADWANIEPLLQGLAPMGVTYRAARLDRRVYYRAFIAPDGLRELEESPYQRGFTFHAITGKRDRNSNLWYGIGRAIVDPQKWVNKFFSSLLYQVMTNAKGGLLAEEGAFADPRKAESEWAKPNSIVYVRPGTLVQGKIQQKDPARYPEGMDRLMQFALSALPETSGLNMELLGLADRVQAGVVEAQRKQSAMAIIAWAFDAMRRYYRTMGRQMATYLIDYVPEQTLVRVNGEQGAQYVPLLKDKLTLTFDVIVDEAPTSTNMKERVWALLENLIPGLLQAGIAVPPDVLDYAPIPTDLQQKWKQLITGDEQAQQKRQEQEQMQREQFLAEIRNIVAQATQREADAALKQAQTTKTAAEAGATMAGQDGGNRGMM